MVDLGQFVGYEYKNEKPVSWNQRDLILYAVGVGAKPNDLSLVYELDKSWAPLPTYPVVLPFKGNSQELNSYLDQKNQGEQPEGFPALDINRIVHGSQSIEILKDLPQVSGDGWKLKSKISAFHENKSGVILERESLLLDSSGVPYARLLSAEFYVGAVVNGTKFSKSVSSAPQSKPVPTNRKPDWVVQDNTSPEQAIVYRLSGDYNPLHIDSKVGVQSGFNGVILHGLSTFGFAARAVIKAVGNDDPRSLTYFGVRFTSPVVPGHALETLIWEMGPGPNGTTEVNFVTKNTTTGKVVLGSGVAFVRKALRSKL
ncbi:Thioesterase/thiol ester dehydrase-isomerase [Leucogyrophana mollusca]|uniref:Thioesterase/thiol ester dehydrase-isomerase n=1 Tax=Leucogyrophana mollusca TaxID=85980 RepID=A0ACB8BU16_9AGAM|nr:Thioesterase/thiol ester dehydrase-isomerase [Leucogyrophana mollusca]